MAGANLSRSPERIIIADAVVILGVPDRTVRELAKRGDIPARLDVCGHSTKRGCAITCGDGKRSYGKAQSTSGPLLAR
jgi:hypothetical protein